MSANTTIRAILPADRTAPTIYSSRDDNSGIDLSAERKAHAYNDLLSEYAAKCLSELTYDERGCQYVLCGKTYTPHNQTQKYCTPECSSAAGRVKQKERRQRRKQKLMEANNGS